MPLSPWRNLSRIIRRYAPIFLIIFTIFGIITLSVGFGCLLFPLWFVSIFHCLFGYFLFRFTLRAALFPGSLLLWKSSVEHSFKSQLSLYLATQVEALYDFVELIASKDIAVQEHSNLHHHKSHNDRNMSLLDAAHAWVTLQNAGHSLDIRQQLSDQWPENSTSSNMDSIYTTLAQSSSYEINHDITINSYRKRNPFRVIGKILFSVLLSYLFPKRRRYSLFNRCTRRCLPSIVDGTLPPTDNVLQVPLQNTLIQIRQCQISVTKHFGCIEPIDSDQSSESSSVTSYLDHDSSTWPNCRISEDFVFWSLGEFLNEVYRRHLLSLQNEASDDTDEFTTSGIEDMIKSIQFIDCNHDFSNLMQMESIIQMDEFSPVRIMKHLRLLLNILQTLHDTKKSFNLFNCPSFLSEYLLEPPVGSLTHLRSELKLKYYGIHFWVYTHDGYRIDAMFLPKESNRSSKTLNAIRERLNGKNQARSLNTTRRNFVSNTTVDHSTVDEISPSSNDKLLESERRDCLQLSTCTKSIESETSEWNWGPVVVFCNPNAGFYETTLYHDDWYGFYINR